MSIKVKLFISRAEGWHLAIRAAERSDSQRKATETRGVTCALEDCIIAVWR